MTDKQKYSSFSTKVSYALMEIMFHRMNIGIMKFHYNTVKTCLFENSLFSMMKFLVKCDLEHLTLHRQYPMYIYTIWFCHCFGIKKLPLFFQIVC